MNVKMKSLLVAVGLLFVSVAQAQTIQAGLAQLDGDQPSKAKATFEGLANSAPNAENLFYLGYYQLRTGDYNAAKATFEKGLAADPKNPLNSVGLGAIQVANKNVAAAKVTFDKILADTKSKNADVLAKIAEAYVMFYDNTKEEGFNKGNNDPGEAIRLLDLIPEKAKKALTADNLIVKGDAFLIKNDGGPAVSAYEQALLLDPKSAKAKVKIGIVYLRGKNYKEAQARYKESIETDSNYAPGYKRYGEYFIIGSQYKNASKYFRKYLEKADATPQVLLETAKLLFLSKDYEGAMKFTQQAEAGGIKDNDIFRMKGWSNIELGNAQLGIENLEQMIKAGVKPYPTDNLYFGKGYQSLGKDSIALTYYEQAAPFDTLNNLNINIHDIKYKEKKFKEAAAATAKAIKWKEAKKERVLSNDYFTLGRDYYFTGAYLPKEDTLGRYEAGMKADTALAGAIGVNDKFAPFYLWRARANSLADYNNSKWSAVPYYQQYLTVVDFAKVDKNTLFEAYKYLGGHQLTVVKDSAKAQEYFNKALEIKPDDPTIKEYLEATTTPATASPAKPKK